MTKGRASHGRKCPLLDLPRAPRHSAARQWQLDVSRRRTVDRYASSEKRFCDLDL